ncbi:MAG TPA: glycerophosphodiester phosphodiesterase [Methylomirabilota bacterium]|nr:glycerophosphodiester phosphodiesterase [Methylomirabilota bacterium]
MLSVEIIAHRGASYDAPENTLLAVNLAWQQGADAVEIDVHMSKDGRMVVIHDDDTGKVAGVRKRVRDQTWAELRALDVGQWKGRSWAGTCLSTLEEVLAVVPAGRRLFIEIKCGSECLPAFVAAFRDSGCQPAQVVPIGFALETMRRVKEALPELEVGWVSDFKRALPSGRWTPTAATLIRQAQAAGLDALDVNGRGPVEAGFVRQVKDAGLKLYVWTVDSPALARRLMAAGVDGITTNRPRWLRERLESADG